MSIPISQILDLVGKLDDSPGDDTPRERFRRFLKDNIVEVGQIRDYVEECLRTKGDQYNRALQDLVNYIGHFLGFEVAFGRYQGVSGQIGFDGHWKSAEGLHIVVEVKTSEAFAIKPATLNRYVDELISTKSIPSWDDALGLFVIGRPDPETRQLENSIIAEKRTSQLRIISVDSLLSLAEMMNEYDIAHEDILAVIRPSTPTIDPVIDLMARLVAEPKEVAGKEETRPPLKPSVESEAAYWLTSVKSTKEETAEECIQKLVGREQIYAFGERTPGRKHLKPGDWICFYESGKGVVAHAIITTSPEKKPHPKVRQSHQYPWVFHLDRSKLYLDDPTVINAGLRSRLDAFEGRDPEGPWAWFVQATRSITHHDFRILTRQQAEN